MHLLLQLTFSNEEKLVWSAWVSMSGDDVSMAGDDISCRFCGCLLGWCWHFSSNNFVLRAGDEVCI